MSNKEHIGLDGAVSQGTSRGVQLADSARNGPAVKSGMMRGCFLRPLLQPACGLIATTMSADSSSPSPAPASVDAAATGAGRARRGGKRQRPRNPAPAATTPDAAPGVAKAPRTPHPVLEQLADLYPHLFGAVFRPLKRGIFQDLLAAHPDAFEREALKVALGIHTRSTRYLHNRRSFSDFWEKQAARSASLGWTAVSQSSVDSKQMDQCYRACSRRARRELLSRYSLPTSCVPGFMKNLYLLICTVPSFASQQACGLRDFFSKDVSSRPGCINRVLPSTLSWASREERNGSS